MVKKVKRYTIFHRQKIRQSETPLIEGQHDDHIAGPHSGLPWKPSKHSASKKPTKPAKMVRR